MNPLVRITAAALLATFALDASAQQMRFPTATQPIPAAPPTTYSAPPASTSPFATTPVSPPLYSQPPSVYTPTTPPVTTAPAAIAPPPVTSTPAPFSSPPAYTPPPSTFSTPAPLTTTPAPYGAAPSMPAPSLAPPAPAPGTVAPPPLFDPYASGTPMGAPPAQVPYSYTPPPPPGTVGPQGAPPMQGPWGAEGQGYYDTTMKLLQELSFEYTFLWGDSGSPFQMEWNRVELTSTFAVPVMYNVEQPLLITPGFAFNWLEGPVADPTAVPLGPVMPPRLYDAYLDFAWYPKVNQWLGAELGVRTGVWSDFDRVTDESIRILGRGLGSVSVSPNLDILLGVVYLDRVKVKLLPAGGVYWRPTPEWDAYIVFPNPKVRKYWTNIGNSKWYWYVAGEYGGGSWTADRAGLPDQLDINDIRVIGGLEWETQTQIRGHIELGYVWDRELVFRSGQPPGDYGLNDTIMLRAGVDF